MTNKVPVLVVSGFLGAGKTTLVRSLLQEAQATGHRLAVVSNEFGELGIDEALLQNESSRGYVELEGGCVCCQLSNELLTTLQGLWERIRPDRVIVETSGVALPFDTLTTFWREPVSVWAGESLAVVVVNAEQLLQKRDLAGTFEQQVSSADILVLNKIDLVPNSHVESLKTILNEYAPDTPIVESVNAAVDSAILFPPDPQNISSRRSHESECGETHTHEQFTSQILPIESGIEEEVLVKRLTELNALRMKGIVQTASGKRLIQGVGPRIDFVDPPDSFPSRLMGKIVVISRA
ncbi:MAG: GTP-binding protein [Nitrospirales bacterium]|nr:GTP-binding protein [Nitrospira sp.]MDR4501297.1 GTP-binding protein [Nitrospirales bacterium]